MVDITESSFPFERIAEGGIAPQRCLKLNDKTIYNFETKNVLAKNTNSCINVIHQIRADDGNFEEAAVGHMLASLLHEPSFKFLRTKKQLGYAVKLEKTDLHKVTHICIKVQSSKYDVEHCEAAINEFLLTFKDGFSEESVEANKKAIINSLAQKSTSLQKEAQINWTHLLNKEYGFDLREKKIEAMQKVTVEQVNALM